MLRGGWRLKDHHVHDGSTVHVVHEMRGGGVHMNKKTQKGKAVKEERQAPKGARAGARTESRVSARAEHRQARRQQRCSASGVRQGQSDSQIRRTWTSPLSRHREVMTKLEKLTSSNL